jgi:hypothetical protein
MLANINYFWYVVRHKYYVYVAGRKLDCGIIQLLIHDLSKFSHDEWTPYVNRFYRGADNKSQFYKALMHHYASNPHHWNFWVDEITGRPNSMPIYYIKEMVADWMGAGKVQTGRYDNVVEWYSKNQNKIQLHPITRVIVENLIPGWEQHCNNLFSIKAV